MKNMKELFDSLVHTGIFGGYKTYEAYRNRNSRMTDKERIEAGQDQAAAEQMQENLDEFKKEEENKDLI